jgi:phosphatidylglycerophosphate synthase
VKISQILSFPNQLTLMRMMFLPFIVIKLVEGHYSSALILFVLAGFSDGLDGLLARTLKQQTTLGQYLDPIADKLLLSTVFLVLSILHQIPWKFTVLVFSRDISILAASAVLYAIAGLRDFPGGGRILRSAAGGSPGTLDRDCPADLPTRRVRFHHHLRAALRVPGGTALVRHSPSHGGCSFGRPEHLTG